MNNNKDISITIQTNLFQGLMNRDQCKQLAQKIMKLYDQDKNDLMEVKDAGNLQSDCYKAINLDFSPSQNDIKGYAKIFDRDGTGKISVNDVERLCFKYFGGGTDSANQKVQKGETIELSPIQAEDKVDTPSKLQYQSPYRRWGSQKSTQGSQTSIQSNKQPATQSCVVPCTTQKEPQKYSKLAEARLQVARRIFKMLDQENNGYITEKHVTPLLVETYNNMGMKIEPTREDIEMWMEMADQDRDGKVYLIDYESLVLKSLKSQGIEID
ncbi:unnamed protein product (macronuclear) [Paramecium tetraurelia]|uniref:EF-hand domain-containing protein n=1 Tax=Paramecium tetraurelia TaxID=5888 RepID=A0CPF0_PARTE|nr:uncharacterized protein GSPATT00009058001 [Paramecium tetraurelia]CAK72667.1 unnamed protein product [Paramecium tetraurelia]|eukprot:XP_001440064.1 hypothetical protein (macronuclear) [Paramecium tetraurelia strain d4-2]